METTVLNKQSCFDIAMSYFGTVQAVFDIAIINDISITDELIPGQLIKLPNKDYGFKEIVKHYRAEKIQPATSGFNTEDTSTDTLDYVFPYILPMT
jgi:hypothetical protein